MPQLAKVLSLAAYRSRSAGAAGAAVSDVATVDPGLRERRARFAVIVLLLAGLGVPALGSLVAIAEAPDGALAHRAAGRARLLGHALDELQSICPTLAAASDILRAHCAEQARFVLTFSECGEKCRRAAATVAPPATR